ncbi:TetR family transcriptional regulator [Ktedonobacter sp. SOSP1-85]|uniref:TetR/AcrR family transcriptional regulator n=1 Tax=Ktedonobacter sp. SOSP1-85 TaxID=2778367 RepID=UPI0019160DBB|nr:TetR/AcrR family transcriptional regulator [Ktedonobacter sp. SOSP1-85]GHO78207.1 TetR family transcriptional regulator [Ktedonobacter sp. SOSP1-85]
MPYRSTERSEQRRQQMRQALITATRDLCVPQGYNATTMQQIVREAGTSIGNRYFYFSTREALLRAVVEDFTTSIGQAIDIAIAPLPPGPEQLAVGLPRAVWATLSQADLARVLLVETRLPELRFTVLHYFLLRLSLFLQAGHLANENTSLELVTLALQGTTFQILESVIMGVTVADEDTIARFLV